VKRVATVRVRWIIPKEDDDRYPFRDAYFDMLDPTEPRDDIDAVRHGIYRFDIADCCFQHIGGIAAIPNIPIPPAEHTARTSDGAMRENG
jgi:hypothetical protein